LTSQSFLSLLPLSLLSLSLSLSLFFSLLPSLSLSGSEIEEDGIREGGKEQARRIIF
jgi:hypothetical protein